MHVFFRADASVSLGTGHVVRCATLAEALQQRGVEVSFACVAETGHMSDWLTSRGFMVHPLADYSAEAFTGLLATLSVHPDWLVVDHYQLDKAWETAVRPAVGRIFVIDDLARDAHDCDALLNQNSLDAVAVVARYQSLLPATAHRLLGPEYALLRPSFVDARQALRSSQYRQRRRHGTARRLLVFMGGTDPRGETMRVLSALERPELAETVAPVEVDVIVGEGNPERELIAQRCNRRNNWRFHCQTDAMADLMLEADFAVTAGGVTTWEKLCVGLPSAVIAVAENQFAVSLEVASVGAQVFLGRPPVLPNAENLASVPIASDAAIQSALFKWLSQANEKKRHDMAQKALFLVDGRGTERVADFLEKV